ncbi:DNA-binding transcriptional regulator, AcrR family [Amycolatopsis arida]|uniref:DNA-binding transcriptional regulator, AcrR family n=1 Tax=Amycolatopsis arida TaxID=587909 RepID=A0A1I5SD13_9PSEU|nr:TetR/AcrR family transcriptional regulator [Amycolatopsis arida]TDX96516.1 AcrR family transcriptional regulator [Amycolatopsis arida]SFP68610.1 DNA-binding transcriptional regulator, AcrR family [Amycolatopsis arida]
MSGPARDGRAARWEGQRERRRAEFVEAAIAAIEEHGPDVLTEQIAARAGVARTRLYRHFADRADLQEAVCRRIVERLMGELAPIWRRGRSPMELITSAVDTILRWLGAHEPLYRYLGRCSRVDSGRSAALGDVTGTFALSLSRLLTGALDTLGRDGRGTEPFCFGLVAFTEASVGRWLARPGDLPAADFSADLVRGLWALLDAFLRERGVPVDPDRPLPEQLPIPALAPDPARSVTPGESERHPANRAFRDRRSGARVSAPRTNADARPHG